MEHVRGKEMEPQCDDVNCIPGHISAVGESSAWRRIWSEVVFA